MAQTFTRTPAIAAPIVPDLVQVYEHEREVRNALHPIAGRADVEATLKAAGLRRGSLVCVFGSEAPARDADARFAEVGLWQYVDGDVPAASMSFVVDGTLSLALDDETQTVWLLTVGFQEVLG
jgi:hypothetical protein